MYFNKFPWSNMHGFNLNWVIETIKSYTAKVDELATEIETFPNIYETIENITNVRKLSNGANFTGTWFGLTPYEAPTLLKPFANVKDFGVLGGGVDDSVAMQLAFDSGLNVFFPDDTYSFADVTCDYDVIVSSQNAIFKPLPLSANSNAKRRMLTFNNQAMVRIMDINIEGDFDIAVPNGDKFNTQSAIKFNGVDTATLENVRCKDFDGTWRLSAPAAWAEREGLVLTFIDCRIRIMNNCVFENWKGEECVWGMFDTLEFEDGATYVNKCEFKNVSGGFSAFGLVGGEQFITKNRFHNIQHSGSLLNAFGVIVKIADNIGDQINVNSIFDTSEGYMVKNEYVEVAGNVFDNVNDGDSIGLQCNSKVTIMDGNNFNCKSQQILMYPATASDPAPTYYKDLATIRDYETVEIVNNIFRDIHGATLPVEFKTLLVIGRHNGYATTERVGLKTLTIKNNTFEIDRADAWHPIYLYAIPNMVSIEGNHFPSLGLVTGSSYGYVRISSNDDAAPIFKMDNNIFRNNNNVDLTGATRANVLFTTGTGNVYKVVTSDNVADVQKAAVDFLEQGFGQNDLTSYDDDGFKV